MKEMISKVKRRPSEWEKIKANEATDKELISKMIHTFKKLLHFTIPHSLQHLTDCRLFDDGHPD